MPKPSEEVHPGGSTAADDLNSKCSLQLGQKETALLHLVFTLRQTATGDRMRRPTNSGSILIDWRPLDQSIQAPGCPGKGKFMRARLVPIFALIMALMITRSEAGESEREPLPQPAPGWSIELAARAPRICNPTSIVVVPDGTIYLDQGPTEKTGSAGSRSGSVLAIKDGKSCVFADGLGTVSGLEWIDGTLYVLHPPELSAFRDTDRDGRADERIELVTGLGPTALATHGINDHLAAGIRAGIDGYLYLAVGDKGVSPYAKLKARSPEV